MLPGEAVSGAAEIERGYTMKHIKIAAGMAGTFDYGNVRENMKEALDAGCE